MGRPREKTNFWYCNKPLSPFVSLVNDMSSEREVIARELVKVARILTGKGKVPEAFKEQWKKNDKGGDDKEDKKPDFLKEKKEKKAKALAHLREAKRLMASIDED